VVAIETAATIATWPAKYATLTTKTGNNFKTLGAIEKTKLHIAE